ncbi:hypothetical protein BAE44_0013838 [Dichanthelium oligosanthes]|uniref:KIB1-4 beta-propeller domain-containing protein n=1 Tax=Dichanthelium oligosanthes TaxID=888268 RepID=A0A1E5VJ96_9POAL|nr:hypothetical protein BAE44_0013838 [Dichanthelium oligosanthes]
MVREEAATPPGPGNNNCRRFRNVSTRECVKIELPELDGHHLLGATAEGLLVLVDESTYAVRILNPLTRQRTELPPLPEIFPKRGIAADVLSARSALGFALQDSTIVLGLAGDSTVVLCCDDPSMMVVAKPGDDRWTPVDGYDDYYDINAGTCFSGRFY